MTETVKDLALPPGRWRVSRVDKGHVRAVHQSALGIGAVVRPDAGRRTGSDGELESDGGTEPDPAAEGTADPGALPAAPGDGPPEPRTWRTSPDGTLPAVVGDPLLPAVGDWLYPDGAQIRIGPRLSELVRDGSDNTSREQVIAANVDAVLIAEHLEPQPALGRIERLLAIAHRSGARPIIVFTKSDLATDAEHWVAQARSIAPAATVLAVSASTGTAIEELREALEEVSTLVLVGPSGAGKSTLVNVLAGEEVMVTGQVRGDSRGMHTTTHRQLVALPTGQVLIDTPGLRSIGLVATAEAVAATFEDVTVLATQCRFGDCAHESEPGCAVLEALEAGDLSERRLESWRKLQREAIRQAARSDARLAAEQHKKRMRSVRANRAARGTARRRQGTDRWN